MNYIDIVKTAEIFINTMDREPSYEEVALASDSAWSVAHEMANQGHRFSDPAVLGLRDGNGRTVAHIMAENGYDFTKPEILAVTDRFGNSIAHAMAERGYMFEDKAILKLSGLGKRTVAHAMAYNGHQIQDPEILDLMDDDGRRVRDIISSREMSIDEMYRYHGIDREDHEKLMEIFS